MEKNIKIIAQYFGKDNFRDYYEYQVSPIRNHYQLRRRTHFENVQGKGETDWTSVDRFSSLREVFEEVFIETRLIEIESGLYEGVRKEFPRGLYTPLINTWIYYYNNLQRNEFHIHGNYSKYSKEESSETTAMYLRFYENEVKRGKWSQSSITEFGMEELFKKEIAEVNRLKFLTDGFQPLPLEQFLRKYYLDFQRQIGRYLVHLNEEEKDMIVNLENINTVQYKFEHHHHPEDTFVGVS